MSLGYCEDCGFLYERCNCKVPADVIGGFPYAEPTCRGCGDVLREENAWMTDGCPCNSPLGVNSPNETRWRLLMQLQQRQARRLEGALDKVEKEEE